MASASKLITVVGDEVILHVESEEAFAPDVEVDFQNVPVDTGPRRDPNAPIPRIFSTEKLAAVPAPLGDPPQGKVGAAIKWKANLNKDPKLESDTAVLVAQVRGRTLAGARRWRRARAVVRAAIRCTDPARRIMLRVRDAGPSETVFRSAPAEAFETYRSSEEALVRHRDGWSRPKQQSSKPKGKLVLFVTFYDQTKKARLMCADNLEGRQAIRANATFSVFHCGDPAVDGSPPLQRGIVLVLHTEFFVVNMANTHAGGRRPGFAKARTGSREPVHGQSGPKPLRFTWPRYGNRALGPAERLDGRGTGCQARHGSMA
jgi:hypothetical protein